MARIFFRLASLLSLLVMTSCFSGVNDFASLTDRPNSDQQKVSFSILKADGQESIVNSLPISWEVNFSEAVEFESNLKNLVSFENASVEYQVEEIEKGLKYKVHVYKAPFSEIGFEIQSDGIKVAEGKSITSMASSLESVDYRQIFKAQGAEYISSFDADEEPSYLQFHAYIDDYLVLKTRDGRYIKTKGTSESSNFVSSTEVISKYQSFGGRHLSLYNNYGNSSKLYSTTDPYSDEEVLIHDFGVVGAHRRGTNSSPYFLSDSNFFYSFKNTVYFLAVHTDGYLWLWKTDASAEGTEAISRLVEVAISNTNIKYEFVESGPDFFLMNISTSEQGTNYYISDGTSAGTSFLGDINPGSGHHLPIFSSGFGHYINGKFLYFGLNASSVYKCFVIENASISELASDQCDITSSMSAPVDLNNISYWIDASLNVVSFDGSTVADSGIDARWMGKLKNGNIIIVDTDKIYKIDNANPSPLEIADISTLVDTTSQYYSFANFVVFIGSNATLGREAYLVDEAGNVNIIEDFNVGPSNSWSTFSPTTINDTFYSYLDIGGEFYIIKIDSTGLMTKIKMQSNFSTDYTFLLTDNFFEINGKILTTASDVGRPNQLFELTTDNQLIPVMNTSLSKKDTLAPAQGMLGQGYFVTVKSVDLNSDQVVSIKTDDYSQVILSKALAGLKVRNPKVLHYSKDRNEWLFSFDMDGIIQVYITDGTLAGTNKVTGIDEPTSIDFYGETKDYYFFRSLDSNPVTYNVYSIAKASTLASKLAIARHGSINISALQNYDFEYDTNVFVFPNPSGKPYYTDGTLANTKNIGPADGSISIDNSSRSVVVNATNILVVDTFGEIYKLDPNDVENPIKLSTLLSSYTIPAINPDHVVALKDKFVFLVYEFSTDLGEIYSWDGDTFQKLADPTVGLGNDYDRNSYLFGLPSSSGFHRSFGYLSNWMIYPETMKMLSNSGNVDLTMNFINGEPICDPYKRECVYSVANQLARGTLDFAQIEAWASVPEGVAEIRATDYSAAVVKTDLGTFSCVNASTKRDIGKDLGSEELLSAGAGVFIYSKLEADDIYRVYKIDCNQASPLSLVGAFDEKGKKAFSLRVIEDKLLISFNGKLMSLSIF
ncbi:MAG: hypothetical protein CL674_02835 [Bdellovibrionaceae bacterium]|nr:hypothetical protein [Pseudobdellovibrionaceae bacterium]|tara:strand:- start:5588 stop:8932 length:3345 start_codon:yes stop_codon:yes gene_type:complete